MDCSSQSSKRGREFLWTPPAGLSFACRFRRSEPAADPAFSAGGSFVGDRVGYRPAVVPRDWRAMVAEDDAVEPVDPPPDGTASARPEGAGLADAPTPLGMSPRMGGADRPPQS